MPADPQASRMNIAEVYGLPDDSVVLNWSDLSNRIASAKHYWIGTVDEDGCPNPRPIDGMWVNNCLVFGGHPNSRWQRNLRANPNASVNLEGAFSAVILHGQVSEIRPDLALAKRIVEASNNKYDLHQSVEDYENKPCAAFMPAWVVAWDTLYEDGTRFDFEPYG